MCCEAGMDNLLDRILLDESAEPTDLPLSLLQSITNNFSDEQRIGNGGFADVYKGVLSNGAVVAVKKLSQQVVIDEKNFKQEVTSLIRARHKNIVRFLGYCAATQGKVESYEGNLIIADIRQRLLCFEFLPKGSLEGYITDASQGLEWSIRYKIIKGICEGLHYLHQKNIVHLDLKPANILLNHNMVPKIADFGLARCFDVKQTRAIASKLYGTLGYMAPEFISSGVITFKSDIYSLGVIITEMLTGQREYSAIENVLESCSSRFQTPQRDTWLELVRICAEIATECIDRNPEIDQASSSVSKFVDEMMLMRVYTAPSPLRRIISVPRGLGETSIEIRSLGDFESSKLLDIYPLEVRFPFEPNKRIECPVTVANMTDHDVHVSITPTCLNKLPYIFPPCNSFRMEPHSIYATPMIMNKQQQQPRLGGRDMFQVLMIVMGSEDDELEECLSSNLRLDSNLLELIKRSGGELHQAVLAAVICEPASQTHQFIPATSEFGDISSIDVHPTETWILTSHERGFVVIWNYRTQEIVRTLQVTKEPGMFGSLFINPDAIGCLYSVEFIARNKWFVTGDGYGYIHVYAYIIMKEVKVFKAHRRNSIDSLAVHPTRPLLLSASKNDSLIKLWDWNQGWVCIRTFDTHTREQCGCVWDIAFNPRDIDTFASGSSGGQAKVWSIHSSNPMITLLARSGSVGYLFTGGNKHFLVSSHGSHESAQVWDLHTKECVHTLKVYGNPIFDVACHPMLPTIATLLGDGSVCLWNETTYRLEKIVHFTDSPPVGGMVFLATNDLTRLVVGYRDGIAIMTQSHNNELTCDS